MLDRVPLVGSVHITGDTLEVRKGQFDRIVVPMRDPRKVAQSWLKRDQRDAQTWVESWEELPGLPAAIETFFFDIEARDIEGLSRFVGYPLETDWEPLNHSDDPVKADWLTEDHINRAVEIWRSLVHRQTERSGRTNSGSSCLPSSMS